jgi:hypothetical protein
VVVFFPREDTRFVYSGCGFSIPIGESDLSKSLILESPGFRNACPSNTSRIQIRNDFGFIRAGANRGAPFDMRTINIFVSSSPDVQKEHAVAGQLIRSAAAEFNLPINVHYSNPLRGSRAQGGSIGCKDFADESALVLCPCFWEYPELQGDDFLEQIPNTGQYDLVICILWSRLGTSSLQQCVMPDGSRPRSATEYEVAWALDQSKRTPGFPELHIYRNRAMPTALLEPKEKLENLCRGWDAVQEFFAAWERNGGAKFRESCHDYRDLEEFADLFRQHFRGFLAGQLDRGIASKKALRKVPFPESNPFRGLNFFDFEDAAFYHGRIKAVGEILDAVKNHAKHKTPFVLVLGQKGSGKSSLVRAGVLPLLTQGGTALGNGPWRHAVTRPGAARDPLDTLAAALGRKFGLPELKDSTSPALASQLREDPDAAVARIAKVLNQLGRQQLDQQKTPVLPADTNHCLDGLSPKSAGQEQPKMRLALVVDQLEELFTGVSLVLQEKYVAALAALANCEGIFTIATLRSDFFPHCQRFPELLKLISFGGKYELQPPTPREIGNMIRFPAEATGLRFEQDPETGRTLDEIILKAAISSPDQLPLLQHLLSRLYQRQLERKDGLLLWSDYRQVGQLRNALAQHAEFVFLTLNRDEQQALKLVTRQLLARGPGGESLFYRRTVPYRDLVASPKLNQRQRVGAKGLVDRLITEGLLSAENDPEQRLLISVPQEVLLRRWPRLWQSLSEDPSVIEMRDRVEARLRSWLSRGFRGNDLLDDEIGLAEAQTLLTDFKSSLNETQIDYIKKSLVRQKRRRRARYNMGLGAIIAFAVFAVFMGVERFIVERRRNDGAQDVRQIAQNSDLAEQRRGLETELKETEEKLQAVQLNADFANKERSALETRLREAAEALKQVQANSGRAASQLSDLQGQLKQEQDRVQKAQVDADAAASQRSALETELKRAQEEKTHLAQQNTDLGNQQSALETQLKEIQEKLQLAQQNADLATSRQTALESELKRAQENRELAASQRDAFQAQLTEVRTKADQAQKNAELATSRDEALQAQLTDVRAEVDQAEKNAGLATSQHDALQTQLKDAEARAQQAQKDAALAASQRGALQTQLTDVSAKAQEAQKNGELAAQQRDALQAQLKDAEAKAQLNQKDAELPANERDVLQAQLKAIETKADQTQKSAELATSQRDALQAQLTEVRAKAQQAEKNAELATSHGQALQARLTDVSAKAQEAQKDSEFAAQQRDALQAQLKATEAKAGQAQKNAELATAQRSAQEAQLKEVQDRLQRAQQTAELASTQRSALETQLKQAKDKLQQNEQTADRATTERSAFQVQLKQALDKLQQVQQTAELALTLEARLRKAEESAQLAQQRADLAASQRSAIETQLKDAEEKAQLGKKIADPIARQEHPAGDGPAKREALKKGTDSANELRSGQALPLDSRRNAEQGISTQGFPAAVQSANH